MLFGGVFIEVAFQVPKYWFGFVSFREGCCKPASYLSQGFHVVLMFVIGKDGYGFSPCICFNHLYQFFGVGFGG